MNTPNIVTLYYVSAWFIRLSPSSINFKSQPWPVYYYGFNIDLLCLFDSKFWIIMSCLKKHDDCFFFHLKTNKAACLHWLKLSINQSKVKCWELVFHAIGTKKNRYGTARKPFGIQFYNFYIISNYFLLYSTPINPKTQTSTTYI